MNRRTFLKWLGIGAVTVAVDPKSLIEPVKSQVDKLPGYESVRGTPVDMSKYDSVSVAGEWHGGDTSEVVFYDKALTAQEVGDIYLKRYGKT